MLTVETIGRIRREHFVNGKTIRQIARDLRVSRNTVRKMLRSGETSLAYDRDVQPLPKLGRWTTDLDELLARNETKAAREQLTLIRIFEELRGRGYEGGYDAVRRYARRAGANVSNCTFDPTFFISPGDGYRTRLKSIASSKLEQGGMKADDVTLALQHGAFEIIVEDDLGDPGPCLKGLNMAAQEVLHAGIKEEAQEDLARIAQHHDEGHQRTACAADHEMTEVCPVDLGLLA